MKTNNKSSLKKTKGDRYVNNPTQALPMVSRSAKAEKITTKNCLHPFHGNGKGGNAVTNKRKYARASMSASVELTLEGHYRLEGYVVNVSFGGMGLYTQKIILVGTEIQIKISFVDGTGIELFEVLSGTVMWNRPVGQWYGMGIQFKCVDPVKHLMLIGYLAMAERTKENIKR